MINAQRCRDELYHHATEELLPFWLDRCIDHTRGGYITHFDADGHDTGVAGKSLIAQARLVYAFSLAARHGIRSEECLSAAAHGVRFLLERMWDGDNEGLVWMVDRDGVPTERRKILYGHSFAVYALSEYFRVSGAQQALAAAERLFELVQTHAVDLAFGGYFEMFEADWTLSGPGAGGGDRKTLDVHMHLMEAYTALVRASAKDSYRRRLAEVIDILMSRMIRPESGTGVPQFTRDWRPAPQIRFDIVWGLDRFPDSGTKPAATDNTSYGHNIELAWLLLDALDALGEDPHRYDEILSRSYDHALRYGIDADYGGVYVEGSHDGPATDTEKEFWQQAECMNGMLAAYLHWGDDRFLDAYGVIHDFVMAKMINHDVGEWLPLLTREGAPIWTHMGNLWKTNYHTIRAVVGCIGLLDGVVGHGVR